MKCLNFACRKVIKNDSQINECSECNETFCSKSCLIHHTSLFHSSNANQENNILSSIHLTSSINNENNENPFSIVERDSSKSLNNNKFIKQGKVLEKYIEEPIHNFHNIEFVKDENNEYIKCGNGFYSEVFLGKNTKENINYAIKIIKKENIPQTNEKIDNIYREIEIQNSLIHPNIIRLYSYKENKDNFYLIMEYAKKGNLISKINKEGKLNEVESFKIFIQICSAIYFLHSNNYIHRDIKSENILINENDEVKLSDFSSCVNKIEGKEKTFTGSYQYKTPDLINDDLYDESIDIWSLGTVLYEMLHGYPPFKNLNNGNFIKDSYFEIFKSVISNVFIIDNKLNLSNECIDMINRLLENDCKKRINIKEIFLHPWVKKFQRFYDGNNFNFDNANIDSQYINNNINVSTYLDDTNVNPEQNKCNNDSDDVYRNTMNKIENIKKEFVRRRNTDAQIVHKNTKDILMVSKFSNDSNEKEKYENSPKHIKRNNDDFYILQSSLNLNNNINNFMKQNDNSNKIQFKNNNNINNNDNKIGIHYQNSEMETPNPDNVINEIPEENPNNNEIKENKEKFIKEKIIENNYNNNKINNNNNNIVEKKIKEKKAYINFVENDAEAALGILNKAAILCPQIKKKKVKAKLIVPKTSFLDELIRKIKQGFQNKDNKKIEIKRK